MRTRTHFKAIGFLGTLLALCFLAFPASAEVTPPSGLADSVQKGLDNGWKAAVGLQGWSSAYEMPQQSFNAEKDSTVSFEDVGYWLYAIRALDQGEYDVNTDANTTPSALLKKVLEKGLAWQWVSDGTPWGTSNGMTFPSGTLASVRSSVKGVLGASGECKEVEASFNQWHFPKDSVNAQPHSEAGRTTAMVLGLLEARAYADESLQASIQDAASHAGEALLGLLVTPDEESFGIHQSLLTDGSGGKVPIGMMAHTLQLKNEEDTFSCADGGTIKVNEVHKHEVVLVALGFQKLYELTQDPRYQKAAQYAMQGVLDLQECDNFLFDYTRWQGTGSGVKLTCKDTEGNEYEPYANNVFVSSNYGDIYDSALNWYLHFQYQPNAYAETKGFKDFLLWVDEIEKKDTVGQGAKKNAADTRHSISGALKVEYTPFPRIALGSMMLRAACQESDESIKDPLQNRAYAYTEKALQTQDLWLETKPPNVLDPSVGRHALALKALGEIQEILVNGCKKCADADKDGYKDLACTEKPGDDCNDANSSIYPGAAEVCDGIDNDCSGKADEPFDSDLDGVTSCSAQKDCDDNNVKRFPGNLETEDSVDNDCNEKIDDGYVHVSLANDANQGVEGARILVFDATSACVTAFELKKENYSTIAGACKAEGECITDANGTCTIEVNKTKNYFALALQNDAGLAASPSAFSTLGQPLYFAMGTGLPGTSNADTNAVQDSNAEANPPLEVSTETIVIGIIGVVIVLGLLAFAWMRLRKQKMPAVELKKSRSPPAEKKKWAIKK
ncbi:MAG: putative metal-binding motif-containing protein [Candidatus Diapherotrites archaeon]|nr:putative metal-binding motif-containing protein [Candidatus Diapherotrites archaeon]